jgi:hypothetical protein
MTYLLAVGVCLSATLLTGVLSGFSLIADGRTVTVVLFVCLPLALALGVISRASLTRTPADVVLAAFATPCLALSAWTLCGYVWTDVTVAPGSLGSLGGGLLLSIVLLTDGIITHVALPERT